uniref:Uncharacterized protein n=1 Tax=Anguilla anguilla TaxID=7936 RepID=A0A0E9R2C3_ANGAN
MLIASQVSCLRRKGKRIIWTNDKRTELILLDLE